MADRLQRKKLEFSKKIIICFLVLNVIIVSCSLYLAVRNNDTAVFCYLIPTIGAEVSAGTATYHSKAKAENKRKIVVSLIKELADKYDIQYALQAAEIVTRD